MARVYGGTDLALDRAVAVKVLRPELAGDQAFVARFAHEALLAAGLVHPDIVAVYDTGTDRDTHYIVMEHVQGRTLADVLREGPLLPERAAEIAEAVAGALSFAHRSGVIHCDVKPANVMVTQSGAVKVMDFGIAQAASARQERGPMVLATANYLAPERARGEPADPRSDVYSLGVVLYEMLVGRPPFVGDAVSVARQHVWDRPPRPSRLNREVPKDLEGIVLRAMAKDRDRRYRSPEQLRMELESARLARLEELSPAVPVRGTAPSTRRGRRSAGRRDRLTAPRGGRGRGWAMAAGEGTAVALVVGLVVWAGLSARPTTSGGGVPGDETVPKRPRATVTSPAPPPVPLAVPTTPAMASASPRPRPSASPSPAPSPSRSPSGVILPLPPLPSITPFP